MRIVGKQTLKGEKMEPKSERLRECRVREGESVTGAMEGGERMENMRDKREYEFYCS